MEPKYHSFRLSDFTPESSSDKVIGSLGILITGKCFFLSQHDDWSDVEIRELQVELCTPR